MDEVLLASAVGVWNLGVSFWIRVDLMGAALSMVHDFLSFVFFRLVDATQK